MQKQKNKKKPQPIRAKAFYFFKKNKIYSDFSLLANFELANRLLNLSIRPAVSTNFILPVKNGWEKAEISNFTTGYSLPSSHVIVSLDGAQERVKMDSSQEKSLNTTILYCFGWISFCMMIFFSISKKRRKDKIFYVLSKCRIVVYQHSFPQFSDVGASMDGHYDLGLFTQM